jgi:fatty-acyl-CoA synthase
VHTEPAPSCLTIPGYLREIAKRYGANEALVLHTKAEDTRWSYETLRERSTELARALIAIGAGKDSRVGVLMSNRPEFVAAAFAVALAGGVTVVLSTFSTAAELEYLLKVSGVSILLYERTVARKDFDEIFCELEPAIGITAPLQSAKFPFLRHLVRFEPHACARATGAIESWPEFLQRARAVPLALVEATALHVKPSDAALLFFSSGTTGLPKGILHAHRAAVIQWWRWPRILGVTGDVRCWTANGFSWSGQFSMVLGCGLSCGGTVVLQPTFDPAEALELIESERVAIPFAWPHQWVKLTEAPNWNSVNLGSLRYVDPRSPLAQHPTVRATDWYEPPAYGATETFTIVAALPGFKPGPGRQHLQGPPLPGNAIKIVDPLSGGVLPNGERGEIAVKGPTLMLGYLGTALSETLDQEGYFHTGDSGYLDEAGQLFWEGRLSDIIKTGGANVSPREIDSILMSYPGVKLSRTVGIPHDTLGEAVVACVVPHEQAAIEEGALRDFLKTRLASYKVPRHLLFFSEEEIAKTGSDKIKADALVLQATRKLASAPE